MMATARWWTVVGVLLSSLLSAHLVTAKIWYLNTNVGAGGNGTKTSPFVDLVSAVNAAGSGDSIEVTGDVSHTFTVSPSNGVLSLLTINKTLTIYVAQGTTSTWTPLATFSPLAYASCIQYSSLPIPANGFLIVGGGATVTFVGMTFKAGANYQSAFIYVKDQGTTVHLSQVNFVFPSSMSSVLSSCYAVFASAGTNVIYDQVVTIGSGAVPNMGSYGGTHYFQDVNSLLVNNSRFTKIYCTGSVKWAQYDYSTLLGWCGALAISYLANTTSSVTVANSFFQDVEGAIMIGPPDGVSIKSTPGAVMNVTVTNTHFSDACGTRDKTNFFAAYGPIYCTTSAQAAGGKQYINVDSSSKFCGDQNDYTIDPPNLCSNVVGSRSRPLTWSDSCGVCEGSNVKDCSGACWNSSTTCSTVNRTIWVSPSGNGDGSSSTTPLGNLTQAISMATPFTTIKLLPGSYGVAKHCPSLHSGAATSICSAGPLTIQGANNEAAEVIIDGTPTASSNLWTGACFVFGAADNRDCVLQDISFLNFFLPDVIFGPVIVTNNGSPTLRRLRVLNANTYCPVFDFKSGFPLLDSAAVGYNINAEINDYRGAVEIGRVSQSCDPTLDVNTGTLPYWLCQDPVAFATIQNSQFFFNMGADSVTMTGVSVGPGAVLPVTVTQGYVGVNLYNNLFVGNGLSFLYNRNGTANLRQYDNPHNPYTITNNAFFVENTSAVFFCSTGSFPDMQMSGNVFCGPSAVFPLPNTRPGFDPGPCPPFTSNTTGQLVVVPTVDKCGVCGGNNSYLDCHGVCFGRSKRDKNGACCYAYQMDCSSVCFGNATFDSTGQCCQPQLIDSCGVCYGVNLCTCGNHVCMNGGTCNGHSTACSCINNWSGPSCTDYTCALPCKNGGFCSAPNSCNCSTALYGGPTCDLIPCAGIFCEHNGVCRTDGTCDCSNTGGYSGYNCSLFSCTSPCLNDGVCVGPNICQCTSNFTGPTCATPVNQVTPCGALVCEHGGSCVMADTCSCVNGYTGHTCNTFSCSPMCQNGGTCISPNVCTCPDTYSGAFCQTGGPVTIIPGNSLANDAVNAVRRASVLLSALACLIAAVFVFS